MVRYGQLLETRVAGRVDFRGSNLFPKEDLPKSFKLTKDINFQCGLLCRHGTAAIPVVVPVPLRQTRPVPSRK